VENCRGTLPYISNPRGQQLISNGVIFPRKIHKEKNAKQHRKVVLKMWGLGKCRVVRNLHKV
jgi:hypothetical protein